MKTMDIRKLTDDVFVAPQIEAGDIPALAVQGFRTIICNRPDGEAPEQPGFGEIELAATTHGVTIRYQPVQAGSISDADVAAFRETVERLPKPVLAYCRSGTRCASLWSLSEAGRRPAQDILGRTRAAGYDMSGLLHRLYA
jgi:sulfide:quinone oxidoreductase